MQTALSKRAHRRPYRISTVSKISSKFFIFAVTMLLSSLLVIPLYSCGPREARGKEQPQAAELQQDKEGEEAGKSSEDKKAVDKSAAGEESGKNESEGKPDKNKEKNGVPVEVSGILVKDISSFLTSTTNIEAENEATVLAEIDGRILKIFKEEGNKVKKGELLAKLDDEEKKIALKKAEVKAENGKANYNRSKELYSQELLSIESFDEVRYQNELAKSELEEAEYNLSKTRIVAPFSGEVTVRHIKLGQNVKPTDPLFTVTNRNLLVAYIYLPEKDALYLDIGQEVKISIPWDETTRYSGVIERISPIVDAQTGTVKITIYARNLPKLIKPGSFVSIHIVKDVHENAILIPKKSVIKDFQESYVFIVEEDTAKKVKVELGFEDNGYVEILSGLEESQKVVSVGQGGLKDGSKVKVITS